MGSPSEIPPQQLLGGKIRLLSRIGRGGMGDVWVARNEATQAEVAVKTLQRSERTELHDERFRREARLAATITHRNVVRIFDLVDDEDGTLGLVMELLRGGTLEAFMREHGPMSSRHGVAVAVALLSALNHVHDKGIVHRDVKPANMFFAVDPDGHLIPKVLDFGIAKLPSASSPLTVDGSVLGTPHYMSPEQIRGADDLDGRSDMFSLAVVLCEMLTGERAFQRDSAAASLAAVLEHEVDPDPRIDPRVWVALSRALAKRPYERFATCGEFAEALRAAVGGSEEDLTLALQELRPRSDAIHPDAFREASDASGSSPRAASAKKASRRGVVVPLVAAGAAALLAVTLTLALTRPPAQDVDASLAARPSSPALGAIGAPTLASGPAPAVAPAPSSVLTTTSTDLGGLALAPPPTVPPTPPTAKASTGSGAGASTRSTPQRPARPAKPAGAGQKPIATSPGF
jgi:eukaryotic-like serine/threonine-protein kinase